ncbi:hypothetical protein JXA84_03480, partial [candidate division WOR-3 bacterium]|nr:hypothetical protein [candidate division WOR-3 bacterium]
MTDHENYRFENSQNFEILESFQILLLENTAFREMIREISEIDTLAAEKSARGEDCSKEENTRRGLVKD